jgi:hypothetical protein
MALDPVTGFCTVARLFGLLVNQDILPGNQCGSQRARTVRKVRGNYGIKPSAGIGFLDNDGKGAIHGLAAEAGLIFGTVRNK